MRPNLERRITLRKNNNIIDTLQPNGNFGNLY